MTELPKYCVYFSTKHLINGRTRGFLSFSMSLMSSTCPEKYKYAHLYRLLTLKPSLQHTVIQRFYLVCVLLCQSEILLYFFEISGIRSNEVQRGHLKKMGHGLYKSTKIPQEAARVPTLAFEQLQGKLR